MFLKYLTNKSIWKTVQMDTESFQIGEIEFIKKKTRISIKTEGKPDAEAMSILRLKT